MDKVELGRIFSVAIGREVESHEFYKGVAAKVQDAEVRKVFTQLAQEELGHMELLEQFKGDPTFLMKFDAPVADYKVAEATELPKLSLEMKPADAIALAMKKEQQAVEFYRGLSRGTTDPEIKRMFDRLAEMELAHKARLESVFVETGYPESF